ncbi:hypothetical protein A2W45_01730 [Candidatus Curtissbacteria bacterium RIFCSPHIGHO2_12_41_11]|uniref:SpoVT-AbrB domain-containing protein n=3 Tax=Candidatus Curtissiibacteriota TaxID=1752717 RepID=A0A1F5HT87_9BACT|nr:MAG: hypothetical protein UT95_C0018G0029 [Candidatus Curtissbacteria bacterium GW2011_GWB1_40_28]KKS04220.1 MAG: hypothetical protein UU56_C0008G0027 [Candidatus Curtissbacteria bacterium GW2011_GWA2_41_24]OGD98146.1 MAG: hypothetical protein A2W45_01730 [Candidatus Curtissbacteria bacterium RIFCSPHIGHO2_12_41_11]OGE07421.1 MAG: hypothetical protein A2W70_03450 [Candidatus Curtissbacteria bacterium RIFCSPLOWO2_02_41_11]
MQQVTVGTKYQVVIPKEVRKKIKGISPGSKVTISSINEDTVTIKTDPTAWVDRLYGMMTEAWKGIDPIREVKKMRNEWEEKLQKFEKSFSK